MIFWVYSKNIILFESHIYANLEQDKNLLLYFEDKENGAPKGLNNLPIAPKRAGSITQLMCPEKRILSTLNVASQNKSY